MKFVWNFSEICVLNLFKVCRQCFATCERNKYDGRLCFGGGIATDVGKDIKIPFNTEAANYNGVANLGLPDTMVLGIPSGLILDSNLDTDAMDNIEDFTAVV